jgi:CRP/FNR family transcriptional regulator, anaerobic regulatory protein
MMHLFPSYIDQVVKLPAEARDAVDGILSIRQVPKGQHLYVSGESCTTAAFVSQGYFRGYYVDRLGEEVTSNFYFAPTITGDYYSNSTSKPTRINIQALDDCGNV